MAIYNPSPTAPIGGDGIDITTTARFEWLFGSTEGELQTSYHLKVYTLNDVLTYDSGAVLSSNQYHDVPSTVFTGDTIYKWNIITNGKQSTQFAIFKALASGIVTIGTLPNPFQYQFYTFTATYAQAQNIKPKVSRFNLYSSTDVLLATSGDIIGVELFHEFNGLENHSSFKIECIVTNQLNVTSTSGKIPFTTDYTFPFATDLATARADKTLGAIVVDWSGVITQIGYVVGTYQFVDGVYGRALHLDDESYLCYDLDYALTKTFSSILYLKLPVDFSGTLFRFLKDGIVEYEIGYFGHTKKFYYKRGNRITSGLPVDLPNPSDWFKFVIKNDEIAYKINGVEYTVR